jgi:hypothetical protein
MFGGGYGTVSQAAQQDGSLFPFTKPRAVYTLFVLMSELDPKDAARIDANSSELMDEFEEHRRAFTAAHPEMTDTSLIFQGWIIQKISSMQLLIQDQVQAINTIEQHLRRKR